MVEIYLYNVKGETVGAIDNTLFVREAGGWKAIIPTVYRRSEELTYSNALEQAFNSKPSSLQKH